MDSVDLAKELGGRWPPSLIRRESTGLPDGFVVDSHAVHIDHVGHARVAVETGRVTGGFAGLRDAPVLFAAWPVSPGRRALAQGIAPTAAALDTLRAALRSVRTNVGGILDYVRLPNVALKLTSALWSRALRAHDLLDALAAELRR